MAGPPPPQATPPPGLPASRCRWKTELVTADFQTTCLALDLVTEMAPAPASSPSLHRPGGSQRPVAICETGTATCWRPSSMGNACRVGPTPHVADYAEARPIIAGDGLNCAFRMILSLHFTTSLQLVWSSPIPDASHTYILEKCYTSWDSY
jgi:hypothetical protein